MVQAKRREVDVNPLTLIAPAAVLSATVCLIGAPTAVAEDLRAGQQRPGAAVAGIETLFAQVRPTATTLDLVPGSDSAPTTVYVDQYFSEGELAELAASDRTLDISGGPAQVNARYRMYVDAQESSRALVEHGFDLLAQRETLLFGSFYLDAGKLLTNGTRGRDRSSERFLFEHRDFALSDAIYLHTSLGHFRSDTPRLLAAGYRFFLPSSILQGGQTALESDIGNLHFAGGEIGSLFGTASQGFERDSGHLLGAGGEYFLGDEWLLAAQWWQTDGAREDTFNHDSVATGVQYESIDGDRRHQLRGLTDSKGNNGIWYDGLHRAGRWTHRLGIFRFDPNLRWTDISIQNDLEGAYWRGDFDSFRWRVSLGSEVNHRDLDDDPILVERYSTRHFANATWLIRRNLDVGGLLAINTEHLEGDIDDRYGINARVFATHRHRRYRMRFEAGALDQEQTNGTRRDYNLRWETDWFVGFVDRIRTEIDLTSSNLGNDQYLIGAIGEKQLTDTLRTSAQAQVVLNEDTNGNQSEDYNLGLGITWEPTANFFIDATGTYNVTESGGAAGLEQPVKTG